MTVDVLCIGDVDVDMFIDIPVAPGLDQKIWGKSHGLKPGGMAANVAVAIARFGGTSRLLAAIGDDTSGDLAIETLCRERVDLAHLVRKQGTATFMCLVLLSPSGEKSLIRLGTAAYLPQPADVAREAFEGVRHVHLTYGSPDLCLQALKAAEEFGLSTSLDLEAADVRGDPSVLRRVLSCIDFLFLNETALAAAVSCLGSLDLSHLRAGAEMIVTAGSRGCRRVTARGATTITGFEVSGVDTTGAGDCFCGAYLACCLGGGDSAECLELAAAAAALSTLEHGAQSAMPHRADAERLVRRYHSVASPKDVPEREI